MHRHRHVALARGGGSGSGEGGARTLVGKENSDQLSCIELVPNFLDLMSNELKENNNKS